MHGYGTQIGIVGLPNVGKSTLFNALLKKRVALSANYPFATIEPNTGVVAVPDKRLEELAVLTRDEERMDSLPPVVPAVVEFVDIAGLVKGASSGEGLGNQFLSHIREVDAIVHVLRDFADENVIRSGSVSPDEDRLTIETELALADLETVGKLVDQQERTVKIATDPIEKSKLEILKKIQENLAEGKVLGHYEVGDERLKKWFKTIPLLTTKPMLYVYNVSEDEYGSKLSSRILDNEIVISAKLEEELVELPESERQDYLKELGVSETGLERLAQKAYKLLGLISYLTAGKKEVRAWTIEEGSKAPEAAGVIHTDFEKGFIRASVVEYQKLIEAQTMTEAKKRGWVRMEGKEYVVRDGDVIEFMVNS